MDTNNKYLDALGTGALVEKVKTNVGYQRTSYSELKKLAHNAALIPGRLYRFQYSLVLPQWRNDVMSGGHDFDIIVEALTTSTFKAEAKAAHAQSYQNCSYSGDTYFAKSDLDAWRIWYDIENDETKYDWACPEGYGVIYRMIDEFGNDVPYDFKNVKFGRARIDDSLSGACIGHLHAHLTSNGNTYTPGDSIFPGLGDDNNGQDPISGGFGLTFSEDYEDYYKAVYASDMLNEIIGLPMVWGLDIAAKLLHYCGIYYAEDPLWTESLGPENYLYTFNSDMNTDSRGIRAEAIENTYQIWKAYEIDDSIAYADGHENNVGPELGFVEATVSIGSPIIFLNEYKGILNNYVFAKTPEHIEPGVDASLNDMAQYPGFVFEIKPGQHPLRDGYIKRDTTNGNVIKPCYMTSDKAEYISNALTELGEMYTETPAIFPAGFDDKLAEIQQRLTQAEANHVQMLNNIVVNSWMYTQPDANDNLLNHYSAVSKGNTFDGCYGVTVMSHSINNIFAKCDAGAALYGWGMTKFLEYNGHSEIDEHDTYVLKSMMDAAIGEFRDNITERVEVIERNYVHIDEAIPMSTIYGWFNDSAQPTISYTPREDGVSYDVVAEGLGSVHLLLDGEEVTNPYVMYMRTEESMANFTAYAEQEGLIPSMVTELSFEMGSAEQTPSPTIDTEALDTPDTEGARYQVTAAATRSGSPVVTLYADGEQVSNPYIVERKDTTDTPIHFSAIAVEEGKTPSVPTEADINIPSRYTHVPELRLTVGDEYYVTEISCDDPGAVITMWQWNDKNSGPGTGTEWINPQVLTADQLSNTVARPQYDDYIHVGFSALVDGKLDSRIVNYEFTIPGTGGSGMIITS